MATAKTFEKTIEHALFWFRDPDSPQIERNAVRGQTVRLLEDDVKRGESYDPPAFTPSPTVAPVEPTIDGSPALPVQQ